MPQYTQEQRVFIVQVFYQTNNIYAVQDQFIARYPNGNVPTEKTIRKTIRKFEERGSIINQNAGRSGRLRTTRTPENIEIVQEALERNPK